MVSEFQTMQLKAAEQRGRSFVLLTEAEVKDIRFTVFRLDFEFFLISSSDHIL